MLVVIDDGGGSMRVFLLAAVIGFLALPGLSAQEKAKGGTKSNLDLPFDAAASTEADEETGEAFVLYGQQYEGQGVFFCCGTGPLCST
jgi:hypothetical protein